VTAIRASDALLRLLEIESVVIVPVDAWEAQAAIFEEVERHPTGLAGDLVIVRIGDTLAAVESPEPGHRVAGSGPPRPPRSSSRDGSRTTSACGKAAAVESTTAIERTDGGRLTAVAHRSVPLCAHRS